MDVLKLADEIIEGRRLNKEDDLRFFVDCNLNALCEGADKIREHFSGDRVDLCSIINGRTGNMLTTVACATIRSDRKMLSSIGRSVKEK